MSDLTDSARLLRGAYGIVQRWRRLPPERRNLLLGQAKDVAVAVTDVSDAVSREIAEMSDRRQRRTFAKQRERALHPSPAFCLASHMVAVLRESGPLPRTELARRVGTSPDERLLKSTLGSAVFWCRLRRLDGDLVAAEDEDSLLDGDPIRETGYFADLTSRIRDHVRGRGLSSFVTIETAVGEPSPLPNRRVVAGLVHLERAGEVHWLNFDLYGVSPDDLPEALAPAPVVRDEEGAPDVRAATARLSRSVLGLRQAMTGKASAGPIIAADPDPPEGEPTTVLGVRPVDVRPVDLRPSQDPRGRTILDGVYTAIEFQLGIGTTGFQFGPQTSCFLFFPDGRFFWGPANSGVLTDADYDRALATDAEHCGTYEVDGDVIDLRWGGGRPAEQRPFQATADGVEIAGTLYSGPPARVEAARDVD